MEPHTMTVIISSFDVHGFVSRVQRVDGELPVEGYVTNDRAQARVPGVPPRRQVETSAHSTVSLTPRKLPPPELVDPPRTYRPP
ncbi:hypothetical protein BD413DRAFT_223464 [Trametes elegans]|nr:hypothetical protein BD413DRAFT_223464 [Trametes elegans]